MADRAKRLFQCYRCGTVHTLEDMPILESHDSLTREELRRLRIRKCRKCDCRTFVS